MPRAAFGTNTSRGMSSMASTRRWSVTLLGRICPSTMLRRAAAYSDMAVAYRKGGRTRRQTGVLRPSCLVAYISSKCHEHNVTRGVSCFAAIRLTGPSKRSIRPLPRCGAPVRGADPRMARWQSGDAADCKSVYVGSIPARASILLFLLGNSQAAWSTATPLPHAAACFRTSAHSVGQVNLHQTFLLSKGLASVGVFAINPPTPDNGATDPG